MSSRHIATFLCLVFLSLAPPLQAQTCTLFVNASDGSDGNAGTQVAPLQSLEVSYQRASEGERVCVSAGEYAFGDDADGIVLSGSHSVTFVLESFAGADTVLVSAPSFEVNVPGGSVGFESGSTSHLRFGEGIAALSTTTLLRLDAGTLDLGSTAALLEASVGSVSLTGAEILFAGGRMLGDHSWEPAARRIRIAGAQNDIVLPAASLPPFSVGSVLELAHSGSVTLESSLTTAEVALQFTGDGITNFAGPVVITASTELAGSAGEVRFRDELLVTAPDISIAIPDIEIAELASSSTNPITLSITAETVHIEAFGPVSSDLNLSLNTNETLVGRPSQTSALVGNLTATNRLTLVGTVETRGFTIDASTLNPFSENARLHLNGDGSVLRIQQRSDMHVVASDSVALSASGPVETIETRSGVLSVINDLSADTLRVDADASVQMNSATTVSVSGLFDLGGELVLPSSANLELDGEAIFQASAELAAFSGNLLLRPSFSDLTLDPQVTLSAPISSEAVSGVIHAPTLSSITVTSGELRWMADDGLLSVGAISVTGGEFYAVGTELNAVSLEVDSGALFVQTDGPLRISDRLHVGAGSLVFPEAGVGPSAGSIATFSFASNIVLPALAIDAPGASSIISGTVTLQSTLHLEAGEIVIEDGSNLLLLSDLSRNEGVFEASPNGSITFSGGGSRTITGFAPTVLPSLVISGPSVLPSSNITVIGDLNMTSGSLSIPDGSSLSVSGGAVFSGGSISLANQSTLFLNEALFDSGASWIADQAELNLGSATHELGGSFSGEFSSVRLSGNVSVAGEWVTSRLVAESDVAFDGNGSITITEELRIDEGVVLDVGTQILEMTSSGESPAILNDGSMTGLGFVRISGSPAADPFTLSGNGWFGRIEVDFDDDSNLVAFSTSDDSLRIGADLLFRSGGVDVNGLPIRFRDDPLIRTVLTNSEGSDAESDGKGLRNVGSFSGMAGLSLEGAMTAPFEISPQWSSHLSRLLIAAVDAVNEPPVFPVRLSGPVSLPGELTTIANSRLLIENGSLRLSGADVQHVIQGHVSGSSDVILAGERSGLQFGSAANVSGITLEGTGATEFFIEAAGLLQRISGSGTLVYWQSSSGGVEVGEFQVDASDIQFSLGQTVFRDALIQISDSAIRFNNGAAWTLLGASSMSLTNSSTWEAQAGSGSIYVSGETTLEAGVPLSAIQLDTGSSLRLDGDLTITDELAVSGADVLFSSHVLTLDGAALQIDMGEGASSPRFTGDFAARSARFVITGTSAISLETDLDLQAVTLDFNGEHADLSSVTANKIQISTGQLRFLQGTVNLGSTDIQISGSTPDLVLFDGGSLEGGSPQTPPVRIVDGVAVLSPSMLRHELHGELIVAGSGNAGITMNQDVSIPSLRLVGSVRLNGNGKTLTSTGRFVFGDQIGSVSTGADATLAIQPGSWVVREGAGQLLATVEAEDFNLIYHIDDGSWTGEERTSGPSLLQTGNELSSTLRALYVVAGNSGTASNEVALSTQTRLTHRLGVLSGTLRTESRLLMGDKAWVIEESVDAEAPGMISGVLSAEAEATVNWSASVTQSRNLSFPAPVDSLLLTYARSQLSLSISSDLEVASAILASNSVIGSRLRLNGNVFQVAGDLIVRGVRLSSAQVAALDVSGDLTLEDGGITENIRASVGGSASLSGLVTNLSFESRGDLMVLGNRFAPQSLRLTGSQQEWTIADPLDLSSLLIDMEAPGRLSVSSTQGPSAVTIAGGLQLLGGIIDSRDITFALDGSVVRPDRPVIPAHFEAPISRLLRTNDVAPLIFPLGFDQAYRPMTLTPTVSPFSDSRIVVEARTEQTYDRTGLPLQAAGIPLVEADSRVYTVSSDVNFAQALPLNIAVFASDADVSDELGLLLNTSDRWELPSGTPLVTPGADGTLIQQAGATGILLGRSVRLGIGQSLPLTSFETKTQYVNVGDSELRVESDGRSFYIPAQAATRVIREGIPQDSFVRSAEVYSEDEAVVWTGSLSQSDGTASWFVLDASESQANVVSTMEPGTNAVLLHNRVSTGEAVRPVIRQGGQDIQLAALSARETSQPVVISESGSELDIESANTGSLLARYDASTPGRSMAELWIVDEGDASPVRLQRVMPSGDFERLSLITAVGSEDDLAIPVRMTLHGNYPNPFAGRTRIVADLPERGSIRIEVYDVTGRRVSTQQIDAQEPQSGREFEIDASDWATGVYYYTLTLRASKRTFLETGKLVVMQ